MIENLTTKTETMTETVKTADALDSALMQLLALIKFPLAKTATCPYHSALKNFFGNILPNYSRFSLGSNFP